MEHLDLERADEQVREQAPVGERWVEVDKVDEQPRDQWQENPRPEGEGLSRPLRPTPEPVHKDYGQDDGDQQEGLDLGGQGAGEGEGDGQRPGPVGIVDVAPEGVDREKDEERDGEIQGRERRVGQDVGRQGKEKDRGERGPPAEESGREPVEDDSGEDAQHQDGEAEQKQVVLGEELAGIPEDGRRECGEEVRKREVADAPRVLPGCPVQVAGVQVSADLVGHGGILDRVVQAVEEEHEEKGDQYDGLDGTHPPVPPEPQAGGGASGTRVGRAVDGRSHGRHAPELSAGMPNSPVLS